MSDSDIGWDESVYGDAVNADGFPDCDPPPHGSQPFIDGSSAKGFGRSSNSTFTGTYVERPDMLTGLSGQPKQPRYP
jgi:hypothetical protein